MDYHSILVPLKFFSQPLSFLYPLDPLVWMATLISIPVFMLAFGFLEMSFYRTARIDWSSIIEYVIRTAFHDPSAAEKLKDLRSYKKMLIITCIFVFFIITTSYAGTKECFFISPA